MFSINKEQPLCGVPVNFILGLFLVFVLVMQPFASYADQQITREGVRINLELKDSPLDRVVKDIKQQTGYTIILSESLVSVPVTGLYTDVTIDNFFTRVLRGKNISILSDENEKLIVVRAFGDKIILREGAISPENLSKIVPGMDITFAELQEQERLNKIALEEALNDPNTIDPVTGLTLGEVREQEEENKMALEEALKSDDIIVPQSGGMNMSEVRENEKQNKMELETKLNDPNTIDPVTDMKLSDLRQAEKENKRILEEALNNPDTIDPWTGLTLRELRESEKRNEAK